ncbi:MAG: MarR family transcriptional regulator [Maritimibacter sp.]|uniref:MarR family winged helix-turn-helix transcriptional regulator n=1 Tax=Maritimibacter sp. TaxID=2003363 RepID=UPI001DCBAEF9|nr:MarR family transcriptional regulator [Maritimibacter sp.]MBL6426747.1 MarR family transcriptional regulator [Maritimibacter sp.]
MRFHVKKILEYLPWMMMLHPQSSAVVPASGTKVIGGGTARAGRGVVRASAGHYDPVKSRGGLHECSRGGDKAGLARTLNDMTQAWRRERPDLNLDPFIVAAAIKQIDTSMEAAFRDLSQAGYSIGPSDLRILLALRRNGPDGAMRPTDLFQSLFITSGAVTKQVDRLIRSKLVSRKIDPAYKRGRIIYLTDEGRRVADEAIELICSPDTAFGRVVDSMSADELAHGMDFLYKLLAYFENVEGLPPVENAAD